VIFVVGSAGIAFYRDHLTQPMYRGDLHARIPYTEQQAANVTKQVIKAISYLHSKSICHRDIKFENVIFESDHPEAVIKVIDFGLSKKYSPHNNILTERGKYLAVGKYTVYHSVRIDVCN
jgi:serine/threonine protein kinase